MPGKAKPGKRKTHSGAKKRMRVTGTGKVRMQKGAHNHRLHPKNKRQLNLGGSLMSLSAGDASNMKKLLG